jgi:hypothetical protein
MCQLHVQEHNRSTMPWTASVEEVSGTLDAMSLAPVLRWSTWHVGRLASVMCDMQNFCVF